jgi:uncharacterized membrane-anchored protein
LQRQLGAVQPHEAFVKVPEITIAFWVIKIFTTGMGETTSDFFVRSFDPPPVVAAAGVLLAISLGAQILSRRYSTWLYWLTVVLVSIFGTMVADVLHIFVGIPYLASTIGFGVALAVILLLWNRNEGTLSIHSVSTRRRETFYWATVLATFALGTAAGDLAASSFGLGYLLSGVAFSVVFALPFVLRQGGRLGEVASFWTAYIITRPLGASFADWMGVSRDRGGLNWGTGWVSLVIAIVVVLTIGWSQRSTKERR